MRAGCKRCAGVGAITARGSDPHGRGYSMVNARFTSQRIGPQNARGQHHRATPLRECRGTAAAKNPEHVVDATNARIVQKLGAERWARALARGETHTHVVGVRQRNTGNGGNRKHSNTLGLSMIAARHEQKGEPHWGIGADAAGSLRWQLHQQSDNSRAPGSWAAARIAGGGQAGGVGWCFTAPRSEPQPRPQATQPGCPAQCC